MHDKITHVVIIYELDINIIDQKGLVAETTLMNLRLKRAERFDKTRSTKQHLKSLILVLQIKLSIHLLKQGWLSDFLWLGAEIRMRHPSYKKTTFNSFGYGPLSTMAQVNLQPPSFTCGRPRLNLVGLELVQYRLYKQRSSISIYQFKFNFQFSSNLNQFNLSIQFINLN